jgi:hypothetical protein
MYIDDNDVEVSPLGSFLVIVFMIFSVSVIIRAEYSSIKYEQKAKHVHGGPSLLARIMRNSVPHAVHTVQHNI